MRGLDCSLCESGPKFLITEGENFQQIRGGQLQGNKKKMPQSSEGLGIFLSLEISFYLLES